MVESKNKFETQVCCNFWQCRTYCGRSCAGVVNEILEVVKRLPTTRCRTDGRCSCAEVAFLRVAADSCGNFLRQSLGEV